MDDDISDRLDRDFCRTLYRDHCGSIFDFDKLPNKELSNYFYAGQFFKLECFVEELLSNDEIPFLPRHSARGRMDFEFTSLANKYFTLLPDFLNVVNILSHDYEYSERINVFKAVSDSLGLLSGHLDWENIWFDPQKRDPRHGGVHVGEIFNELVARIRIEWKSKFKGKARVRGKEADERHTEYCNYADSLSLLPSE